MARTTQAQLNKKVGNKPGDHTRARKVMRVINKVITWIEVLVLLGLLLFGVYAIWDNEKIDHENTASEYQMYKPTAKDTRSYDDFRKLNPDVCGWIMIDDTGIDYPMVHGDDNDEYMNTTPDLKFALSGSIFLDYRNKADFSDYNTIIYGHHMEGPSMFGALDQYTDADYFKNHEDGLIYFKGHWHKLEIFAYLEVDAYDQGVYSIAASKAEYKNYLSYIKQTAKEYRDVGVDTDDHIVVLSTCMTDKTNGRYIVTGKIGKVTAGPKSQTTGRIFSRDGLSPQMWNLIFAIIGGLIILLLILLYIWYRKRQRRKQAQKERLAAKSGTPPGGVKNITIAEDGVVEEMKTEKVAATGAAVDISADKKSRKGRKSGKKGNNKKKKKASAKDDLINLLIRIGIIIVIIWVVFTFIFGIFVNSGVGMNPSVQDRDIVLFYRLDSQYNANEAVVYEVNGQEQLGRIVARGGDTVEITDEGLKVNGYLQQDYKDVGETLAVKGGTDYPVTLASDEFFILGDNREESTDSRMFGPVKLSEIKGSVMTVLRRRDV